MNSTTKIKPPTWFLVVGGLAFVWNLIGVAAYFGQANMDLSGLPEAQCNFYETIPHWATAAFALAVFAGTVGSLALILKQSWAIPVLILSCLGIVVQMTHAIFIGDSLSVFGTSALALPLTTLLIGLALIGFAIFSKNKSWL